MTFHTKTKVLGVGYYSKAMIMNRYLLPFLAIILLLLAFSCKKEGCKANSNANCMCPEYYDPVCGCDKVTYGNSCMAECSGITEYSTGKCN
jgi:hypothetical protein